MRFAISAPSFHPYTQIHLVIHGIYALLLVLELHCGYSFLFYSFCCCSSYYFFDFSLGFDYFDSFVVFLDHLLRDQNLHVFVWSSLLFPTCINCCRTWSHYRSCLRCFYLRLWSDNFSRNCLFTLTTLLTFLLYLGCLVLLVAFFTTTCIFRILLCL